MRGSLRRLAVEVGQMALREAMLQQELLSRRRGGVLAATQRSHPRALRDEFGSSAVSPEEEDSWQEG